MYEFLAPWGVLAPMTTAAITYLYVTEKRREAMMELIALPEATFEPLKSISPSFSRRNLLSKAYG